MKYRYWILGNVILVSVFTLFLWNYKMTGFLEDLGEGVGRLATLLFLSNISMFFVFMIIKKAAKREIKIFFAKFSRKFFKTHIPFAATGTGIILIHAISMVIKKGLYNLDLKMIFGYIGLFFLIITLTSGYVRYRRATGFRRKFHLYTGALFVLTFIIHIFI